MDLSTIKKIAAFLTAAVLASGTTACRTDYTSDGGYITTADPSLFETVTETAVIAEAEVVTTAEDSGPKALFDREGNIVQTPESVNTIISCSPSVTEILVGLGAGGRIIAADIYSRGAAGISPDICSLDTEELDTDKIISLSPDVMIVSGVSSGGADDPYAALGNAGVNIVYIPVSNSISGIKLDIEFIAAYVGLEEKGRSLIADIDEAVRIVSDNAALVNQAKSVYFETSAAPALASCGSDTLIDELITLAGGRNIYSSERGSFANSEESVIAADPDVIITSVSYSGYDCNEISSRAGWENIKAVRNGEIRQVDASSAARPSQNIINGIYQVAAAIYPDIYGEY